MRRTARYLIAIIIFLAGLEAVLQAAHFYALRREARSALADPAASVILCLGDSHTYGAGVAADEAYPARLQAMLAAKGYRVNVVNLGAPGTNTSEIRRRLPQWLASYHPAAVIVLASVNNGWNRRDMAWSDAQDGLPVPLMTKLTDFLMTRVRTIRLVTIMIHRLDWTRPPEESARDRSGNLVLHHREEADKVETASAGYLRVRRDLTAIVAQVRAAHAGPLLMTYVSDPEYTFETPNRALREAASAMNVALADNDHALRPLFIRPDGSIVRAARASLFFPDMHPSAQGYKMIAGNVEKTLASSGALAALKRAGP
ncbi:MAG TPA: GDSL-type esterase/lipase family protein [bacterium]|nr:GDSL-type esterase/lipase family protein [bacterium]